LTVNRLIRGCCLCGFGRLEFFEALPEISKLQPQGLEFLGLLGCLKKAL
jgi:hypothetical protein